VSGLLWMARKEAAETSDVPQGDRRAARLWGAIYFEKNPYTHPEKSVQKQSGGNTACVNPTSIPPTPTSLAKLSFKDLTGVITPSVWFFDIGTDRRPDMIQEARWLVQGLVDTSLVFI